MKPVRFVAVLLSIALFATFVGITFPVTQGVPAHGALTQGINLADLDLALQSPMTLMSGAPAVTFTIAAVSASSNYSCSLVAQSPADWTRMGRRQYFDAKWTVKNTGTKNWPAGLDFKYISGTKIHTNGNNYELKTNVGPGKKTTLIADMNAPKYIGYYSAYWGLFTGNIAFCRVSITINVSH